MRISPLVNKKMTGEYWDFTTTLNEVDGQVDTYFLVGPISFTAIVAEKGTLYIYVDEQLRYNAQIRNIKDTTGKLLFGNNDLEGTVAYVGVGEPIINVWGQRVGFRYDLSEMFTG